ncbi:beta-ketoacyl synthase N-terminal-like domain-containing protein [Streptomyces sp. P9-2B-2]|uniref:beta-ketoacyl synthase N-terminal-like domain-containing protein n=1 Tax=Streptomyces sp. P9-2B-2 TaxID=3057114 RepID=UPI0025B40CFD|nr:beta-ketoacyl synthase N-terminal-like domain-containing protein [Streptomyces sp. P9-2B-2]WJY35885.1 beta-ketoacyl synthase N-terminal-like domain-containing protein [Streptomyces sp. P9-2B-2]
MTAGTTTPRAVAVTGLGVLSVGGAGTEALWRLCANGGGNFRPVEHFDVSGTGACIAGFIPDTHGAPAPGSDGRLPYLLHRALAQALADAARRGAHDRARTALVLATTDSAGCATAEAWRAWADGSRESCRTIWAPPAEAVRFDGPVLPVGNASAAGAAALGVGADLIRSGVTERAVVCGVDTITETAFQGLASLRTLSPGGCRPFSRSRSGIRISECAAALVLDADPGDDSAPPHAYLRGWGSSNEADQAARPASEGVAKAVSRALSDAAVAPGDVGYVNAHAAGTRHGDVAELDALERVFGDRLAGIPVSGSKAALGHCQGAAGTVEAIVTVLTLARGEVLPTLGLEDVPEQWSHLDFALGGPRRSTPPRAGLTVSCGLGGSNVAVVFGRAAA